MLLFFQLITQRETEFWNSAKAFQIAIANCQTFIVSFSWANSTTGKSVLVDFIFKTAKSVIGSSAKIEASYSFASWVIIV